MKLEREAGIPFLIYINTLSVTGASVATLQRQQQRYWLSHRSIYLRRSPTALSETRSSSRTIPTKESPRSAASIPSLGGNERQEATSTQNGTRSRPPGSKIQSIMQHDKGKGKASRSLARCDYPRSDPSNDLLRRDGCRDQKTNPNRAPSLPLHLS